MDDGQLCTHACMYVCVVGVRHACRIPNSRGAECARKSVHRCMHAETVETCLWSDLDGVIACMQDPAAPLPQRLGGALAAAGPGISLAALAEVSAFSLAGAVAPMPAVRAFGWAAALAVALDFILQARSRVDTSCQLGRPVMRCGDYLMYAFGQKSCLVRHIWYGICMPMHGNAPEQCRCIVDQLYNGMLCLPKKYQNTMGVSINSICSSR